MVVRTRHESANVSLINADRVLRVHSSARSGSLQPQLGRATAYCRFPDRGSSIALVEKRSSRSERPPPPQCQELREAPAPHSSVRACSSALSCQLLRLFRSEQSELAAREQLPEVSIEADEVFANVRHGSR